MTYASALTAHLARYKRERLGVLEDGLWSRNQKRYPHLLPKNLRRLNILETIRREFWEHDKTRHVRLHRDFHHLNSSQALTFNLFFPHFTLRDASASILGALGVRHGTVREWNFEAVPDRDEGTNFDFVISLNDDRRILIEVKLSETEFGTCASDPAHDAKLRDTYADRLREKIAEPCLTKEWFFANYQLFRNVWHVDVEKSDVLVLLLPRANRLAWGNAEVFLEKLTTACKSSVKLVALEDICAELARETAHGASFLHAHMHFFAEKYLVPESPNTTTGN